MRIVAGVLPSPRHIRSVARELSPRLMWLGFQQGYTLGQVTQQEPAKYSGHKVMPGYEQGHATLFLMHTWAA